jgi:hypothetical protein
MALEDLLSKVINDYAGTAARVQGLEDSVHELKNITAEALKGINEALRSNSAILEKFNGNYEDHKAIRHRIDLNEDTSKELKAELRELNEKVNGMAVKCAAVEHEELKEEVKEQEKIIQKYEKDYDIVHSGPLKWLVSMLVTMITLGFMADMTYHYDYLKKALFK